ncbi:AarF/ABC1/UbiB kinase family protein [Cohnella lubricantis]|uniref:AarF/ABC1/UbiB kinase family protein n=1 Tax=Cohnella lubricantis TaxID=2163172 RepID=A0A841TEQ9_9BACL|nr:AarF/ABC1/UbiB kinase family protein [Cohnella lubricantis]MBB6677788.1 AarF/ABC1/UbiB kinase family protein [Cohnella lubricantis]MBP2119002.1 ubiquinone biosynthesis protein [Cohnella lubricantis]
MDVGKRIRHFQRYREIVSAFVRYGFGYVVKDMGLAELVPMRLRWTERAELDKSSIAIRVRMFLEELGPTFVKLGQLASTRSDLLPPEFIEELRRLQDDVPPFAFEEVKRIIEEQLQAPLEQLFREFTDTPHAAASIGQVHFAVLPDGAQVAVKVQRPNIRKAIETDLEILTELSRHAERRLEWARRYRLKEMTEELGAALLGELDYDRERRNAEKFAVLSEALPYIRIPSVYRQLSSDKVLTMERVEGIKLTDRDQLLQEGRPLADIAGKLVTALLHQIVIDGFFHGDPHPGNVLSLEDGRLALLDFGMVGKLPPDTKAHFASFLIALRGQSTDGVIRAIERLGLVPDNVERNKLRAEVDEMREIYYNAPLSEISLAESIREFLELARRHNIRVPSDMTLLGKTLMTLEGVVTSLDPTFSIIQAAEPFGRQLLLDRLNPARLALKLGKRIPEIAEWLAETPAKLKELLALAKQGKIKLELSIPEREAFLQKLDRIGNRLSFSIVLLSFSILMVGLIIGSSISHQQTVLWRIPAIEIGFGLAGLMFLWLIYSIFRSGRF